MSVPPGNYMCQFSGQPRNNWRIQLVIPLAWWVAPFDIHGSMPVCGSLGRFRSVLRPHHSLGAGKASTECLSLYSMILVWVKRRPNLTMHRNHPQGMWRMESGLNIVFSCVTQHDLPRMAVSRAIACATRQKIHPTKSFIAPLNLRQIQPLRWSHPIIRLNKEHSGQTSRLNNWTAQINLTPSHRRSKRAQRRTRT